jgi:hypothetical protein
MEVYDVARWCMVVCGGVRNNVSLHAPSLARRPRTTLVCTCGRASVDTFYAPAGLNDNHIFGTGNVGQFQRKLKDMIVNISVMI